MSLRVNFYFKANVDIKDGERDGGARYEEGEGCARVDGSIRGAYLGMRKSYFVGGLKIETDCITH